MVWTDEMTETLIVVPIRYPLQAPGVRTVGRALELAADHENPTCTSST